MQSVRNLHGVCLADKLDLFAKRYQLRRRKKVVVVLCAKGKNVCVVKIITTLRKAPVAANCTATKSPIRWKLLVKCFMSFQRRRLLR